MEEDKKNKSDELEPEKLQSQESTDFIENKKCFLETEGEVTELLPGTTFKVSLNTGQEIIGHLSGRMRMHRIRILPGDKVIIEMSPYDLTKGRITKRI